MLEENPPKQTYDGCKLWFFRLVNKKRITDRKGMFL